MNTLNDACPCCAGSARFIRSQKLLDLIQSGLYECLVCDSLFWSPLPSSEQLLRYYSDQHGRYDNETQDKMASLQASWLFSKLNENNLLRDDLKYYEFGCGQGWLVKQVQDRGVDAMGFEPDSVAVKWGKENLGVNLYEGGVDYEVTLNKNFHHESGAAIISLMHVLEHLKEPKLILDKLSSYYDSILLFIEVPDCKYESSIIKLDNFSYTSTGQHFSSFTKKGLELMLQSLGFEIVSSEKIGSNTYWNSYNRYLKLWNKIESKYFFWKHNKLSVFDLIFSMGHFIFLAIKLWILNKISEILKQNSREKLPVLRILVKKNL